MVRLAYWFPPQLWCIACCYLVGDIHCVLDLIYQPRLGRFKLCHKYTTLLYTFRVLYYSVEIVGCMSYSSFFESLLPSSLILCFYYTIYISLPFWIFLLVFGHADHRIFHIIDVHGHFVPTVLVVYCNELGYPLAAIHELY